MAELEIAGAKIKVQTSNYHTYHLYANSQTMGRFELFSRINQ